MIEEKTQFPKAVWFNEKHFDLFNTIAISGYTSQEFSDFVKTAFHEKIDRIILEKKNV